MRRARDVRAELSRSQASVKKSKFPNWKTFSTLKNDFFLKVRELGLAVMLLGVVVVFLLCNVLALIANLLEVKSNIDWCGN